MVTIRPNTRRTDDPDDACDKGSKLTQLNAWTNGELFEQYSQILNELRRRQVIRTKNAPAGDYAEWLVQRALGGTLAPNSEKSFDLQTDDGTLVQVKARVVSNKIRGSQRQMSPFRSWNFDQAAMIQFAEHDYTIVRAVLVPVDEVRNASTWRSHVNGSTAHMTEALLTSPGSQDITESVAAAAELSSAEISSWTAPAGDS